MRACYDTLDHQRIIERYQQGDSLRELAKEFSASKALILKVLRSHNAPIRRRGGYNQKRYEKMETKYDTLDHQLVIKDYPEKSTRDIAKKFGISTGLVIKVLRAYNVPMRPQGGYNRKKPIERDSKFKEQAIHLYFNEKCSLAECGRRLGITAYHLAKLIKDWGLPLRKKGKGTHKWEKLDADKVVHLYTKKMQSTADIAHTFHVSPAVIVQVLKSKSIERRTTTQLHTLIREKEEVETKLPKVAIVTNTSLPDISIKEKILNMREQENAKIQDIATTLAISTVDVYSVLRDAGTL